MRTDGTDALKSPGTALALFCDRIARGSLPPRLAAWFASAPLTPLRKRDGGVRPIAVGETLRRLVGKLLMTRVRDRAAAIVLPSQKGVDVRCGADAIVYAARHHARVLGHDRHAGLLQLELSNAFHLIWRRRCCAPSAHISTSSSRASDLSTPGEEDPHPWVGDMRMRSAQGVQQDDLMGPLFFSLAL